jgi:hypothetical protein
VYGTICSKSKSEFSLGRRLGCSCHDSRLIEGLLG